MMCVKETLPPRPRFRWLLITVRLSIINFAGMARTEVAVGTESDASMLWTTRALTPRMGSSAAAPGVTNVGIGLTTGSAGVGVADAFTGGCEGVVTVVGAIVDIVGAEEVGAGVAGAEEVGAEEVGAGVSGAAGVVGVAEGVEVGTAADLGIGGVPPRGAPTSGGRTSVVATVAEVGAE